MRYCSNPTNLVRDADLSGTNGTPSDVIYRTDTAAKAGGGRVSLDGPYTGAADTAIDVEIVDNGGGSTQTSQPIFGGVGSGVMSGVAVAGADPQEIVVTLEDLGTETRFAYATFQGADLKARVSGSSGNLIAIDVDHSGLVFSDTDWSLQGDLLQDQNEYIGDHWDFGAAALELPALTIPPNAPRIRFGNDPQVYRAYKKYVAGRYVYSFSPAPVRDVARGARVHLVSGSRTITITDGIDTDTLTGIVTLYDALSAIRDDSTLVRVDSPIVNDRAPNGQGITELSVRTRSYVLGVTSTDGAIARVELAIEAADDAPTETLTLECVDVSIPGAERWDVHGDVSGDLPQAITGLEYIGGRYIATIPIPPVVPGQASGTMVVEYLPGQGHDPESPMPSLCVDRPRIGAAARDGEWTYTYTKRPTAPCDCTAADLEGGPIDDCLGTVPEGGDVSEASQLIRIQRLMKARRSIVNDNTSPILAANRRDIDYLNASFKILLDALKKLSGGTLANPVWLASHAYAIDVIAESVNRNGFRFAVKVAGTSGSSEPTWNTTIDADTTDGGVTWTCVGKTPYGMWDDAFDALLVDVEALRELLLASTIPAPWPSGSVSVDDVAYGHSDSSATVRTGLYRATTSGTVGAEEPIELFASLAEEVIDGTVTWKLVSLYQPVNGSDTYFQRYATQMSEVLAAAGIVESNFDSANTKGDGCWQDRDTTYWWVFDGSEPYLPIFTGVYYHSSKMGMDDSGSPYAYSTREFGFGPRFGCPDSLLEGDQIRIKITGASGSSGHGYQVGDAFSVRINNANPLPLGGGQTGDDTLTWSVIASEDGRLDDYALVTTAPVAYSAAIGAGTIDFAISVGGVPYALGDKFTLSIEGGRFKWRQDGGSWSSPIDIADTALVDGLEAHFMGGGAPSWVAGDRWSFRAESVNGIEQIRKPIDGSFEWTGSTVIEVEGGDPIVGVLIAGHTIPSSATIRLQGSDDDFATTPVDVVVPWRRDNIWKAVAADRAKYRLTVNEGGSIRWLYLGEGTQLALASGVTELGTLTKRVRIAGVAVRRGLGVTVEHSGLPQSAIDDLLSLLDDAGTNDDRLFGIVPNDSESECGLVRFNADTLELSDVLGFQPEDPANRLASLSMELEAA